MLELQVIHLHGHTKRGDDSMPTPDNDARMKRDFKWYLQHQEEMVEKYNGKVIAIQEGKVLGAYEDYWIAVRETEKDHAPETFLVQLVTPGTEAYTSTFIGLHVSAS